MKFCRVETFRLYFFCYSRISQHHCGGGEHDDCLSSFDSEEMRWDLSAAIPFCCSRISRKRWPQQWEEKQENERLLNVFPKPKKG